MLLHNGGFAQYIAVNPAQCVPYRDEAEARVIAFAEPLAVCIHAIRQADKERAAKVQLIF